MREALPGRERRITNFPTAETHAANTTIAGAKSHRNRDPRSTATPTRTTGAHQSLPAICNVRRLMSVATV
jgi:hypothetical protein